jgi:hypothetical protein
MDYKLYLTPMAIKYGLFVLPVMLGLLLIANCTDNSQVDTPQVLQNDGLVPPPDVIFEPAVGSTPTLETSSPDDPAAPQAIAIATLKPTMYALSLDSPVLDATRDGEGVATPALQEVTATPSVITNVIGTSVGGRSIQVYRFGTGEIQLVLVGGLHGGYEWNTAILAYLFIEYFLQEGEQVLDDITIHIIPNANPDGIYAVTGLEGSFQPTDVISDTVPGRFNGRGVDLNRNWDCRWSPTSFWRDQFVSTGETPFSEPESVALRDYFLSLRPSLVVFWHSAADAVYPSGCPDPHERSYELANVYGNAANYPVYTTFEHYPITGDAGDWLTTQDIASIAVELETHEDIDWERNLAGVLALIDHFSSHSTDDQSRSQWTYPSLIER